MENNELSNLIKNLPKAELHLHIEGSFEPELLFKIAKRNNVPLKYSSEKALADAYNFNNLQEFLDLYYAGTNVLLHEIDFFELTWDYLKRVNSQNVIHTEIFFDPQSHTERGVDFDIVITGIHKALVKGKKEFGITYKLICSFLRHLSEESAFKTFNESLKFSNWIDGYGLDSSEIGNPPAKFQKVFASVKEKGFKVVAHAGEEGPVGYIWDSIKLLKVDRIDHGNKSIEDKELMDYLVKNNIALTLCPLSNLSLKVVNKLTDHPLLKLMNNNVVVTVNSDDPAYFGGYINENYIQITKALKLSKTQIIKLVENSFKASWLTPLEKELAFNKIHDAIKNS